MYHDVFILADDYAHESVGFLTWHRLLLLTIEREMQVLLNDSSFSIPYWDWTDFEGQTDWNTLLFSDDKLGSHDENGTISGSYYSGDNWQTTCWPPPSTEFCDPSMHGIQPIIRCSNNTACTAVAELFPSRRDVIRALTQYQVWADPDNEDYDPFNKYAKNSFCNFLEGFELQPRENADPYLSSSITVNGTLKSMNRALHNVVSLYYCVPTVFIHSENDIITLNKFCICINISYISVNNKVVSTVGRCICVLCSLQCYILFVYVAT